jgi:hypothetical protein
VAPPRDTRQKHDARTAVQALHHALRTLREHPDAPTLLQTARRECLRALQAACSDRPLVLQLRAGAVHIDGVAALPFGPGEAPFDALQRAGIGELVLGPDLPPTAVETLLARLAAVRGLLNHDVARGADAAVGAAAVVDTEPRLAALVVPVVSTKGGVAALDAAGVPTWFDLDRLEGGDDYDRKIQANIGRCGYFVPVISASTQRRHEGYFRREWSYAVDRSRNIADGAVFILPVCIDDTPEAEALVPEKFRALHISRLPGGEPSPEFVRRLRDLVGGGRP